MIDKLDAPYGAAECVVQREGARSRTAQYVIEWPDENCDVMPDGPAKSPDVSLIERLRAIMPKIVPSMEPNTIGDLRIALISGWEMVKQSTVSKF